MNAGLPMTDWLLGLSLRATAIVLLAGAVAWVLRRRSAAARHLVWALACIGLLALPALVILSPAAPLRILPTPAWQASGRSLPSPTRSHAGTPIYPVAGSSPSIAGTPRPGSPVALPPVPLRSISTPAIHQPVSLMQWLVWLWALGFLLIAGSWLIGLLLAMRLSRRGDACAEIEQELGALAQRTRLRSRIALRLSPDCRTPLTIGLFHPIVLLPIAASAWPIEQRRSVLLHELGHIARLDFAAQAIGQLACAMHWFNPLAWLATRQLRIEQELACDDWVVNEQTAAPVYASHLVAIAAGVRGERWIHMGVSMARRAGLPRRIKTILDSSVDHRCLTGRAVALMAAIALTILLPLAGVTLEARQAATVPAVGLPVAPATEPSAANRQLDLLIVDAQGKPIAGANARIMDEPKSTRLSVNAAGHVALSFVSAPSFARIRADAPGYVRKDLYFGDRQLPLPASYTVRLDRGVRIGGHVVDQDGAAIAGAHVVLWVATPLQKEVEGVSDKQTCITGPDGSWSFDNVLAEADAVQVGAWDYRYASDGEYPLNNYPLDELLGGKVKLTLHKGAAITGQIVGPDGQPLSGARVWAGDNSGSEDSNAVTPIITGADGRFAYVADPHTIFIITASHKSYATEMKILDVAAQNPPMTIALKLAKALEIDVVDSKDKPIAGAACSYIFWRDHRTLEVPQKSDANGRIVWDEAPVDGVQIGIDGTGVGFVADGITATAGGEPVKVVLKPIAHVSGTVVDDETGKPIDLFNVVRGSQQPDKSISWEPGGIEFHHGVFHSREISNSNGYRVRIESAGYESVASPLYTLEAGDQKFDVRLKRGSTMAVTVQTEDGLPAGDAVGVLSDKGIGLLVEDGMDFPEGSVNQAKTDAKGVMALPLQTGDFLLLVSSPYGVAQIRSADLTKSTSRVTLHPWAKLHGRCFIGKNPSPGQTISIDASGILLYEPKAPTVEYTIRAHTQADGSFSFDRVPPGHIVVTRERYNDKGGAWAEESGEVINLAPGQQTDIVLGGKGRPVEGHIVLPDALKRRNDWRYNTAEISLEYTPAPEPALPPELKGAPRDQIDEWLSHYVASDAGAAYRESLWKDRQQQVKDHVLFIQDDGSFRVEDVLPGDYMVRLDVYSKSAEAAKTATFLARSDMKFTVPPMPSGRDDTPLVLAPIQLQMMDADNARSPATTRSHPSTP